MRLTYSPLWHLLYNRKIKKMAFRDMVGISNSTLAKLGKDEVVALDVILRICEALDCRIEDIMQVEHDNA